MRSILVVARRQSDGMLAVLAFSLKTRAASDPAVAVAGVEWAVVVVVFVGLT